MEITTTKMVEKTLKSIFVEKEVMKLEVWMMSIQMLMSIIQLI